MGERGEKPPTQVARHQGRDGILPERNAGLLLRLVAPAERGVLLIINLGELTFSPAQLARFRHALSEPTCMMTHMFIDQLRLTWSYSRPTGGNESLRAAQKTAWTEPGNQWKRMFMAQIRQNRGKHDLFQLTADEAQNAVVRQAVNNWMGSPI